VFRNLNLSSSQFDDCVVEKMRVGILGGGLAGLAAANFLKHDFEVLEKNEECGGLCRGLREKGFTSGNGRGLEA
jgi:uncharacterized protein with NAD-binding domain and iron-sulfur cluster